MIEFFVGISVGAVIGAYLLLLYVLYRVASYENSLTDLRRDVDTLDTKLTEALAQDERYEETKRGV